MKSKATQAGSKGPNPETPTADTATTSQRLREIDGDLFQIELAAERISGLTLLLAEHHDKSTDGHSTFVLATNVFCEFESSLQAVKTKVWNLSRELGELEKEGGAK